MNNARTAEQARGRVSKQLALLPPNARPVPLQELVQEFQGATLPDWPEVSFGLCRADHNILNFIRRPGAWASVDCENGGWGDPAYEIADIMLHPAYRTVSAQRWDWVVNTYSRLMGDSALALRIHTYYRVLAVWWVARTARYLYEFPRGLDARLAGRPVNWQDDVRAKYEQYVSQATGLYGL